MGTGGSYAVDARDTRPKRHFGAKIPNLDPVHLHRPIPREITTLRKVGIACEDSGAMAALNETFG